MTKEERRKKNMTEGQGYMARAYFIESTVYNFMKHKQDFDFIKYGRTLKADKEYVRLGDIQGNAVTLDVTGRSLEAIAEDIGRIILIGKENIAPPDNIVTDQDVKRSIHHLFK